MSDETRYAYRVTQVQGCMVARVKPGEYMIERRFMGNRHDWNVYRRPEMTWIGCVIGKYAGKVAMIDGELTAESRALLWDPPGEPDPDT